MPTGHHVPVAIASVGAYRPPSPDDSHCHPQFALAHDCLFAHLPRHPSCSHVLQSPDKTLRLLTDFWHVLTKEQGNERLLQECITWMQARIK